MNRRSRTFSVFRGDLMKRTAMSCAWALAGLVVGFAPFGCLAYLWVGVERSIFPPTADMGVVDELSPVTFAILLGGTVAALVLASFGWRHGARNEEAVSEDRAA
jgi:hypothetical protein